jgi:peptidoglycan lytic transglycosylase
VARVLTALAVPAVAGLTVPVAWSAAGRPEPEDHAVPTAVVAAPAPTHRRLNVRVGQAAIVAGSAGSQAAGRTVALQRRTHRGWRTIDRDRAGARGAYRLTHVPRDATSARLRVRVAPTATQPAVRRRVGRLNAYRRASASWYGPGLYGARTACGQTLSPGLVGVAHRSLPCGATVTLRRGDRIVRARVVDRGPFAAGREFDLTAATRRALGFGSTGTVEVAV